LVSRKDSKELVLHDWWYLMLRKEEETPAEVTVIVARAPPILPN